MILLFTFQISTHFTYFTKEQVFVEALNATCQHYRIVVLASGPFNLLLELLFVSITYQVDLVPHLDVLFFEHTGRNSNLLNDLQHCILLEIGLRMADVPHMHEQVSMVELFEGGLEAINETVRQISNEADCVHHYCLLAVWQTDLPLGCIECLEESIL